RPARAVPPLQRGPARPRAPGGHPDARGDRRRGRADGRHSRVQRRRPGRAEERLRLDLPPAGRLRPPGQAGRPDRHLPRAARHRPVPVRAEEHVRLLPVPGDAGTRGGHALRAQVLRRGRKPHGPGGHRAHRDPLREAPRPRAREPDGGRGPMITRTFVSRTSAGAPRAGAGGHPCQGLYHAPKGARPKVALIATHYQIDFSEHYLADYMARRGFGFLGWNTRFRGYEWNFRLDPAAVDIGVGVRWLREEAGVDAVVLLGNSGGGSLMAAYQAQAVDPTLSPPIDHRPVPGVDELPAADGYISLAAHLGRPDVLTAWMDAAVVDE